MSSISNFEDIEGWAKARELTKKIYNVTERNKMSRDFGLIDQLQRASISIMSNIAEGFERGGNQDLFSSFSKQEHLVRKFNHNFTL
jgi:four helix bundle protein